MPVLEDRPKKLRWPRSQKFTLSEKGVTAEADYRSTIVLSREDAGRNRAAFDTARTAWAKTWGVETDDGLYLCEISASPKTMQELVTALEACDKTKQDAIDAVGRTFDAGLLVAVVPPPSAPAPNPYAMRPRRW